PVEHLHLLDRAADGQVGDGGVPPVELHQRLALPRHLGDPVGGAQPVHHRGRDLLAPPPPPGAVIMKSTGTAFSTPTATDSEKLSITTETPVIRVTPTASATAVAEARLGLRRALATASRPGVPSSRPGRKPTRRTAGP